MSLDTLSKLGRVEQEFEIINGLTVKLHTLSAVEQQQALASVPDAVNDDIAKFYHLQQALLVYATDSINGQVLSKDDLRKLYGEMQNAIFQAIFEKYNALAEEQNKLIEDLKKK
jgi:hypothetical protein